MQYYDVYNLQANGEFVIRAELIVIAMIYRWHRDAETRIRNNGPKATDMFGNGKHDDVRVVPVMDDWRPTMMPSIADACI